MLHILAVLPYSEDQKSILRSYEERHDVKFTFINNADVSLELVESADIIIGNVSPDLLHRPGRLKWMQLNSAGADIYCKPGYLGEDTILTCATGAYGLSVSEWMLTASLMLDRKMDLYGRNQVKRHWHNELQVSTPYQSTCLVLGLGDIGQDYAKKMKDLGSYVIGVRRKPSEKPDWLDEIHTTEELDDLLPRADYVAMVLPGTPETEHIMDERRLRLMKPTAYLINAGRGNAIDPVALNKVLREGGVIGGAALDVTEPEPLPEEDPLWDAPRCIITPHIAGLFNLPETFKRLFQITLDNLDSYLSGDLQQMRNIVDRATGYRTR